VKLSNRPWLVALATFLTFAAITPGGGGFV
jgi:hypothetical protein